MAVPTVTDLWKLYQPVNERDCDSWKTDAGRAAHLLAHLGSRRAFSLGLLDVDAYRAKRKREDTYRGAPPSPATLDRELELLKRLLNYAVRAKVLSANPLADVAPLAVKNTRKSIVGEADFEALLAATPAHLQGILVMAFDTGMRIGEVLALRWEQYDEEAGCFRLGADETKTEEARNVYLTGRARAVVAASPRVKTLAGEDVEFVFVSSRTGSQYRDIRRAFKAAALAIGKPGLWVHDLRRSFITRARRKGIAQRVIMRMSGHKTESTFRRYNIVEDEDVAAAASKLD